MADTDAGPEIVNVQVRLFCPPLEHAPDQIASLPFEMLRVIEVPVVNDADPELPTATLMPVGLVVTRSPDLPLALTVNVAVWPDGGGGGGGLDPDGFSVSVALFVTFS